MKINILPPKIFNLLAAGEVVENPASVVKECVENSVDAGAEAIEISIKNGGMDEIVISDNGYGISESEVEKVFLPHATSKIEKVKDLERIGSLGFRGEAMSSVASVSKVTLTTKTKDDITATEISLDGGEIISKVKIAGKDGTTIRVKNIFYNTPARKKFLQSPTYERNKVTSTVQKLMLANPEISFRYTIDEEVMYLQNTLDERNLLSVINVIYGKETSESVIEVKSGNELLGVSGYVSMPTFTKRNRTYQTTMINGRTIDGGIVADAVNDAFSTYMTTGNFPFFVLNLSVDTSQIDVNVHPRKAQVRLEREGEIYDFVRQSVIQALDEYLYKKSAVFTAEKTADEIINLTRHFPKESDKVILSTIKHFAMPSETSQVEFTAPNIMKILDEKYHKEVEPKPKKGKTKQEKIIEEKLNMQIFGTIFDCYILLKAEDRFVIIDQHAAHERLLYDQMKSQIDAGNIEVQSLIEPLLLYLNPTELNHVTTLIPYLEKYGFEIEIFGSNCVRVSSVPLIISACDSIGLFLNVLLGETSGKKAQMLSSIIDEKIITTCCRMAIKGGKSLTHDQIKMFLDNFRDKKIVPTCPHGRPVILGYSKVEMEKLFARK